MIINDHYGDWVVYLYSGRKVLETRGANETCRIASLEEELKEAQFISEDSNRKLEEVS